jgi:hypothetical protein
VTEPSPRQVLYALVAGGFLAVVAILVIGAAVSGLVPVWWTTVTGVVLGATSIWAAINWRKTAIVLSASIGLFLIWTIGTLIVAT